jgi:hypothetical protein
VNVAWVTACADGKKVFERLFNDGDTAEVPFSEYALIRSGNAGGLELTVSGKALGLMGPWGTVKMIRATKDGYEFVAPSQNNSCGGK